MNSSRSPEAGSVQSLGDAGRLWHNRSYMTFVAGTGVSEFGDQMITAVIGLIVYGAAGGITAVSLMWILKALTRLGAAPFAGVVADRYGRRRVLVSSSIALAACSAGMALVVHSVSALLALVALLQLVNSFYGPASSGLMPTLLAKRDLQKGNAYFRSVMNFARLAGPAAGGVTLELFVAQPVVLLNAASYLILAAALARLQLAPRPPSDAPPRWITALKDGLRFVRNTRVLALLVGLAVIDSMVWRAVEIVLVPVAHGDPAIGAAGLGSAFTALALGSLAGSVAAGRLGGLLERPWLMFACYGLLTVPLGLLAAHISLLTLLVAMGLAGVLLDLFGVTAMTLIQQRTPDGMLGRVFGLEGAAIALGAIPVALAAIPLVHDLSFNAVFLVCAAAVAVTGAVAAVKMT